MSANLDKPVSAQRYATRDGWRSETTPAAWAFRPARWAAVQGRGVSAASDHASSCARIGAAECQSAPTARGGLCGPQGTRGRSQAMRRGFKGELNAFKGTLPASGARVAPKGGGEGLKVRGRPAATRPERLGGMSPARECPATPRHCGTPVATAPPRAYHRSAAAKSAAGFGSPSPEAHMRPSPDAGAFLLPASDGRSQPVQWRAVRGSRKARRSSGRSSNRAPSATPFGSGLAVTQLPEDRTMKHHPSAAPAADFPPSLHLPIEAPRAAWPRLLDLAAAALEDRTATGREVLALELRAIAEALRAEVAA